MARILTDFIGKIPAKLLLKQYLFLHSLYRFARLIYNKSTGETTAHSFYSDGNVYGLVNEPCTYNAKVILTGFTDTQTHWAKNDIVFATSHGLISGTKATAFAPDTDITRADFLMALGKLSGADVSKYKTSSFTDVTTDSSSMPYIQWAVENNIVQGIDNRQFGPDQTITREQMAVMPVAYAKSTNQTLPQIFATVTFSDSSNISVGAKQATAAVQRADIMTGKTSTKLTLRAVQPVPKSVLFCAGLQKVQSSAKKAEHKPAKANGHISMARS